MTDANATSFFLGWELTRLDTIYSRRYFVFAVCKLIVSPKYDYPRVGPHPPN